VPDQYETAAHFKSLAQVHYARRRFGRVALWSSPAPTGSGRSAPERASPNPRPAAPQIAGSVTPFGTSGTRRS
jgi:hypothetical protein